MNAILIQEILEDAQCKIKHISRKSTHFTLIDLPSNYPYKCGAKPKEKKRMLDISDNFFLIHDNL